VIAANMMMTPAHRWRSRLGLMALRPLLADVLSELPGAQEVDEPGTEDRHISSDAVARIRIGPEAEPVLTRSPSPPAPRRRAPARRRGRALTSTTSPSRSSSGTMVAAWAASETACASPSKPSPIAAASGPTSPARSTSAAPAAPRARRGSRARARPAQHVAEHGNAPEPAGARRRVAEVGQSGAHRHWVGVVAVVDDRNSARQAHPVTASWAEQEIDAAARAARRRHARRRPRPADWSADAPG